jgi:predicted O-methyltransferase YrrM
MESNTIDRPHGMMASELKILAELVQTSKAKKALEIGMAFGSSTLAVLEALRAVPDAHLTSIDPFQMHQRLRTAASVRVMAAWDCRTYGRPV